MQTSSNFFNKSFFSIQSKEEDITSRQNKKTYRENVISSDPFTSKQQLTPWTSINPKYNSKIKVKEKIKSDQIIKNELTQIQETKQPQQQKVTSNLFNFYKSKLNLAKVKQKKSGRIKLKKKLQQSQKSQQFSLPSINTKRQEQQIQKSLTKQEQQKKSLSKQGKRKKFIQSINIRQYLNQLKQKQKVVALATIESSNQNFTVNRYARKKQQQISKSIQLKKQKHLNRYQTYDPYDNINGLQTSFQIYKQAAQIQLKNQQKKYQHQSSKEKDVNYLLYEKNMFKNNIKLSSLIFNEQKGTNINISSKLLPLKKASTISYNNRSSNLRSLHY